MRPLNVDFNARIIRSDQRPTDQRSNVTSQLRDMQTMNRFPGQKGNTPQDPRRAANPLQNPLQKSPRGVEEDEGKVKKTFRFFLIFLMKFNFFRRI